MSQIRFRDPAGSVRTGRLTDGFVRFADRRYDPSAVELLPPCEPSKLVCVGRNYVAHADERGSDVPDRPLLFLKPPNTVSSHGRTVTLPGGKDRIDHEAELAVVIDRQCRSVPAADAMDVVRGYTAAIDLSNRDDQDREQNWVRGKAFDNAAPLGPAIVDPTAVPADASVELSVNGERRQQGSLDQLIFDVPTLIEEITAYLTLEPGDVILTGTPSGVAPVADGDEVAVEIEGIPRLEVDIRIPSA